MTSSEAGQGLDSISYRHFKKNRKLSKWIYFHRPSSTPFLVRQRDIGPLQTVCVVRAFSRAKLSIICCCSQGVRGESENTQNSFRMYMYKGKVGEREKETDQVAVALLSTKAKQRIFDNVAKRRKGENHHNNNAKRLLQQATIYVCILVVVM